MKHNKKFSIPTPLLIILCIIFVVFVIYVLNNINSPTCNKPYILVGTTCCLDQNNNNICDSDEQQTSEIQQQSSQKAMPTTSNPPTPNCIQKNVEDVAVNERGSLRFGTLISVPDGLKNQEKQICFDIPSGKSTKGIIQFSSPVWFMVNTKQAVLCSSQLNCPYDLGYATGSQITYRTFDFGWTGHDELCLDAIGYATNDVPITYDVLIKTYGTETVCN